jgi:hypothetical protein
MSTGIRRAFVDWKLSGTMESIFIVLLRKDPIYRKHIKAQAFQTKSPMQSFDFKIAGAMNLYR